MKLWTGEPGTKKAHKDFVRHYPLIHSEKIKRYFLIKKAVDYNLDISLKELEIQVIGRYPCLAPSFSVGRYIKSSPGDILKGLHPIYFERVSAAWIPRTHGLTPPSGNQ
jgi:hypothetical protein